MGIKINMQKVFDKVEWSVLTKTLATIGFSGRFASLIMQYIITVSFELLLNGFVVEGFQAERGLRQGDPLSIFLFMLFPELLSMLLFKANVKGLIHSIKVSRAAPSPDHLLFAYDLILFCRANLHETGCLKFCLE